MASGLTNLSEHEERFGAIAFAYLRAREEGRRPDPREWLARYPEFSPELAGFFADQEAVDRLGAPLREIARAADRPSTEGPAATAAEHEATRPPAAPRSFGDYDVLEEMARGGMGVVYRARQRSLNRLVALKVIRAGEWASAEDVRRFRNEAETVALLDHPHVVPVYEVGEQAGQLYFSMKLVEGGSLAGHLDRYRDDPRAAAGLLATVARAVHHAHQRGVLHRDLKPSNILLDESGRPHITDFGLARRVEADSSLTQSGAIVGTPSYMAPEQATGRKAAVTTATDVYGLGAVLYALLTGRPPFQAENALETLLQVREREPEPPSGANRRADRDLETICLKCLAKEPQRRYGSALALAEDLDRFLTGQPILARPVGVWERGIKWARRRPLAVAAAALALAVLVLGGGVLLREQWQRAAVERAVEPGLERAELLQEQERWEEALGILTVADGQLEVRGASALRERIKQRKRDVDILMRLRGARLQEMFGDGEMGFDHAGADSSYLEAFAGYDLDVTALDPQEAAGRIRASAICTHLIVGLDDWAFTRDNLVKQGGAPLRALADLADDDPWRRRLRGAVVRRDRILLAALAEEHGTQSQPLSSVLLLGRALSARHSWAAAERLLRQFQQRYPENFTVNYNLATALFLKEPSDPADAVRFLQAALALQPRIPVAYINIGAALLKQGKPAEAYAACQKAIELKPESAQAYYSLGGALRDLGKRAEACMAWQKAIELKPDFTAAHWNLGLNLRNQGRFAESLTALKRALELGFQQPDWPSSRTWLVRQVELFVEFDAKLPEFLRGDAQPRDAAERIELAEFCSYWLPEPKRRYAAAARFSAEAFAAEPKLAENLSRHHLSNAACRAVLAACGQGLDASDLDQRERARLRRQALDWLRADLAAWRRALEKDAARVGPVLARHLRGDYLQDEDFATVRDEAALTRLPAEERDAWQKLWAAVEDLLTRVGDKIPGSKK